MKCPFCNAELDEQTKVCPVCNKEIPAAKENKEQAVQLKKEEPEASEENEKDTAGTVENAEEAVKAEPVNESEEAVKEEAETEAAPEEKTENPEEKPKKKSGKLIIGGAVVAAVAAVGIFSAVKMMEKDPKDVVIDAFKSVYSEDVVYPSEELFGFQEISKNSRKKNMEGGFKLTFEQSNDENVNMFAGSGLDVTSKYDIENKAISVEMGTQLASMDFLSMDIYIDKEDLLVALPELSERTFQLPYGDDFEEQLKNSPVMGEAFAQSGIKPNAFNDYMDYIWSFYEDDEKRPFNIEALWERYKEGSKAIDDFKTAMTVEKAEGQTLTINGADEKCKGYHVVISQEALVNFVQTTSKFFMEDEGLKADVLEYLQQLQNLSGSNGIYGSMTPEEMQKKAWDTVQEYADQAVAAMQESVNDIDMMVYVDKKGRLAGFDATTNLDMEDGTYALSMESRLKGGSYMTQNADVEMSINKDGEVVTITAERDGVYDDAQLTSNLKVTLKGEGTEMTGGYEGSYDRATGDYTFKMLGDTGFGSGDITARGTISDLKKGESIDISMDTIDVTLNDEKIATLSGDYYIKPLEGEPKQPEGEKLNLLKATEADLNEVGEEMGQNIQGIMMMIYGILLG